MYSLNDTINKYKSLHFDNIKQLFANIFLSSAHPILTVALKGTPQNFTLRKRVHKTIYGKNADNIFKPLSYID
jgi:hypothetical protein